VARPVHSQFLALDAVVGESGSITETLKVVYTPLFCVWFLAAFVVLEGRDLRMIPSVLRAEWLELFRGNVAFFLSLTGIIYSSVPREERVLAFGVASLVYTWILSLWNSAREERRSAAGMEMCSLSDEDCVPLRAPPRSRALLSVAMRRTLIRVRRPWQRRRSGNLSMRLLGATDADADDGAPLPLLDRWARLEDGSFYGTTQVDGHMLWIRAPSVVREGPDGTPERIQTLNGLVFELGTPSLHAQVKETRQASRRLGDEWKVPLVETSVWPPSDIMYRRLSAVAGLWPLVLVASTLALSNEYGVIPGTCIGPAATIP